MVSKESLDQIEDSIRRDIKNFEEVVEEFSPTLTPEERAFFEKYLEEDRAFIEELDRTSSSNKYYLIMTRIKKGFPI